MRRLMTALLFTSSLAAAAGGSVLQQRFMGSVQPREGRYVLVSGPESCQEGPLRVLDFGDELTLMLGANPLVTAIGKDHDVTRDRECVATTSGQFTGRVVTGQRVQKCGKQEFRFEVKAELGDQGLQYTRRVYVDGKIHLQENCVLKLSGN